MADAPAEVVDTAEERTGWRPEIVETMVRYPIFWRAASCAVVRGAPGEGFDLLMVNPRWAPDKYDLPGGFGKILDLGRENERPESLEDCARREVEEETGVSSERVRIVGTLGVYDDVYEMNGLKIPEIHVVFIAVIHGGTDDLSFAPADDVVGVGWHPRSSLLDLPKAFASMNRTVEDLVFLYNKGRLIPMLPG